MKKTINIEFLYFSEEGVDKRCSSITELIERYKKGAVIEVYGFLIESKNKDDQVANKNLISTSPVISLVKKGKKIKFVTKVKNKYCIVI